MRIQVINRDEVVPRRNSQDQWVLKKDPIQDQDLEHHPTVKVTTTEFTSKK